MFLYSSSKDIDTAKSIKIATKTKFNSTISEIVIHFKNTYSFYATGSDRQSDEPQVFIYTLFSKVPDSAN